MALLITDCPHCGTASSGMPIFGVKVFPVQKEVSRGHDGHGSSLFSWPISIAAMCQRCSKPSCAILGGGTPTTKSYYKNFIQAAAALLQGEGNVVDLGYKVASIWPEPPEPSVPAHTPPTVERAMLQAEKNFPIEGNEEASAMMYRRALELALSDLYPDQKGTLAKRINDLVKKSILPEPMGQWVDEIRQLGNDAAHDPDEVDRPQLTMIRGFTDAALRYLYTLPAEVTSRRKLQANAE